MCVFMRMGWGREGEEREIDKEIENNGRGLKTERKKIKR